VTEFAVGWQQLRPRQREVLTLRCIWGLSRRETADHLGLATETVADHMRRGVAKLMPRSKGDPRGTLYTPAVCYRLGMMDGCDREHS
jgi:DNA-directed RNA polymerase specialized sigma24 family protein